MVGAQDFGVSVPMKTAAQLNDADRRIQQILRRHQTPAHNVLGIDRGDLRVEILTAIAGFFVRGIPISGWAAAQDVADVKFRANEFAGDNDLVHQLARAADKRFALFVFVRSGSFADEHDLRFGIANPKNGLSPRGCQVLTTGALSHSSREFGKRLGAFIAREI